MYKCASQVLSGFVDPLYTGRSTAILIMRRVVFSVRTDSLEKQVPDNRISLIGAILDVQIGSVRNDSAVQRDS